jgi:murein tripeptide amidase MpaA
MKQIATLLFTLLLAVTAQAQKPRPDAFPPVPDTLAPKVVNMATTIEEMASWDRYPTYEVYVALMQRFAADYPTLCHLDTIGTSVQGRLILSLAITGSSLTEIYRPEFLYSSTMHGDEVTGFYLMLRLCDTLLSSYGTSPELTNLLDRVRIYINPLSNPDGTYL